MNNDTPNLEAQLKDREACCLVYKHKLEEMEYVFYQTQQFVKNSKEKLDDLISIEVQLKQNGHVNELNSIIQKRLNAEKQYKRNFAILDQNRFFVLDTKAKFNEVENEIAQLKGLIRLQNK